MAIVAVIDLAQLPPAGQAPEAIEDVLPGSLYRKELGYNSVELAVSLQGSASFALYSYWQEDKTWRPEGPRGTTPVTFTEFTGTFIDEMIPARISVPMANRLLAVVKVADLDDPRAIVAILQPQLR